MYILRLLLLATTALVSAEVAQAQDLPKRQGAIARLAQHKPKPPGFDWHGFHIGIGGGGAFMRATAFVHSHASQSALNGGYFETYTVDQTINRTLNASGVFGTLSLGYDRATDKLVYGVFGNLNLQNLSASAATVNNTPSGVNGTTIPATATLSHEVGIRTSVDFGARAGFLVNERTLLYGLAGASIAQLHANSTFTVQHDPSSALESFSLGTGTSTWRGGFVVGAGLEVMLTQKVSVQTEYRYADYGKIGSQNAVTLVDGSATISQSDRVINQSIRAVLNYHF
jgi:opacity protein-like surface antigen